MCVYSSSLLLASPRPPRTNRCLTFKRPLSFLPFWIIEIHLLPPPQPPSPENHMRNPESFLTRSLRRIRLSNLWKCKHCGWSSGGRACSSLPRLIDCPVPLSLTADECERSFPPLSLYVRHHRQSAGPNPIRQWTANAAAGQAFGFGRPQHSKHQAARFARVWSSLFLVCFPRSHPPQIALMPSFETTRVYNLSFPLYLPLFPAVVCHRLPLWQLHTDMRIPAFPGGRM